MIRPTPIWRSVAMLGVAGLVLAACGDDGGSTAEPAGEASSSAPAEEASEEPAAAAEISEECASAEGDGTLTLGTLLPQTGNLAFLGPPEFAGVDLAVQDINAAGGVNGTPVEKFDSDSGDTSTDIASQSVDRLLSQNVDAVLGAASSGVSFTVIDKITGACAIHFSPANTSPDFTDYDDGGLFFRTAPSDVLQGRVLSELLLEDGQATVGIMALQDPYGEGLAANVESGLTDGGGEVVATEIYDPKAANFAAEVTSIKSADPAAIVLIGFDESAKIIEELVKQGIGPDVKPLYLVDGNTGNALGKKLPPGTLEGVKGTIPGAEATQDFRDRLLTINPGLTDYSYSAESYDTAVLTALAAQAAGNDTGGAVASELVNVSGGGEKCTDFAACLALLEAGEDIDYDGKSGPIEFSPQGDPTEASIGIYTYGPDNKLLPEVDFRSGKI